MKKAKKIKHEQKPKDRLVHGVSGDYYIRDYSKLKKRPKKKRNKMTKIEKIERDYKNEKPEFELWPSLKPPLKDK